MEDKKNIRCSYALLVIILFATVCFLTDYIVIDRKLREDKTIIYDDNVTDNANNSSDNKFEVITQGELDDIIEDQLYIFYGKKNLTDITNQNKLSLSVRLFNKADGGIIDSFTSKKLEDSFNSTVISNLGISHESIVPVKSVLEDGNIGYGYTYTDGNYSDYVSTNSGVSAVHMIYNKIVAFNENDGKYTLSIKYLWGGYGEYLMDDSGVYAKYVDSINGQNSIASVPDDVLMGSYEDLQNWGKENFSSFEDKLEKYNFVFVKENGKINLVDFYVD